MKIRINGLRTLALISLLSLFSFATQAGAQDNTLNQRSGSPKLRAKAGDIPKQKVAVPASGYTYKVLYNFCTYGCLDGSGPNGGLIQDAAGNLYGTTTHGGANADGTVFEVDSTGYETVLYSFCASSNCTDGAFPYGGLVRDAAGNLYGTTSSGGAGNGGTVFKVDSTGHETVLYSFCPDSNCTDWSGPGPGLIRDASGNLYGTALSGGANNYGMVFKLDTAGNETVLYSFCSAPGCTDGSGPLGLIIQDAAGNFYGSTTTGGNPYSDCHFHAFSCGTAFKLDSTGHETVLYVFCSAPNCTDGAYPVAGPLQDAADNLYGTTVFGGNSGSSCLEGALGCGTVFKLDTTGHETVLYSFCSVLNCTDGSGPSGALIQDAAGNLFGTTSGGGNASSYCGEFRCGTVFKLDSTDHETVLYAFCTAANCTDGAYPQAGLIQDAAGNLYGTASGGGANNAGVVFKLAPGAMGTATVALTSAPNPSYVDQSVTFSAVVSGSGATPTGTVTFEEGSTALGTVTLANGKANLTTAFTSAGSFSIVASYSGDINYNAANSSSLTQVVNQYTTSTVLASSLNPSTYGQAVTLMATVSSAGPTPTGTVTFKNGKTSLGSASLSGGVASLTKSNLYVGTVKITASYGGDAANAVSASPVLKQVVVKAISATTVVSSVNPSKVGQTVKFTATVTSPTTTPTGKVTFMDGSTVLGTGTLAKGKASYSTSTLGHGSHNITAVYAGTANIIGSTSPVLVQTVN